LDATNRNEKSQLESIQAGFWSFKLSGTSP
jgi:hypothetical protein